MAKKKRTVKQKNHIKSYGSSEKKSFWKGFFAGLFKGKQKKITKTSKKKVIKRRTLLEDIKYHRDHNLGVLYRNGKYYDTNFIDKPHEIDKDFVKELHSEYDLENKRSDLEVADMYVRHMRHKYGSFDKNGRFLGMLGE